MLKLQIVWYRVYVKESRCGYFRKHIEGQTIVVTCSALKWSYRDILKYGGLRDYCKLNTGKSSSTELIHQVPKTFNLDGDQSNETISYTQPVTRHGESVQVATTHDNTFVKQEGTEFRNNRNAGLGPNDDGPKRNGQKNEKSTDKNDVQRVSNGSYHSGQVRAEINRAPDNKDEVQIAETSIESKGKPERMMKVDTSQFSPIFVHLTGSPAVLEERLSNRQGHFMPKSLLQSQLDVLEPLGSDENGFTVDIDKSLEDLVMEIKAKLEDTKH